MSQPVRAVLVALAAAVVALVVVAPGAADTSGSETFKGVIVTSGTSGDRVVVSSMVLAKGAFDGTGRLVEVPNLPGDPDNVSRDDLVFSEGTIHIVSTTLDFSFSLNPQSCLFSVALQQTGEVVGGTGQFAAASGSSTATVTGKGILARNPDGSCSVEQNPLHEVDKTESSGTLTF